MADHRRDRRRAAARAPPPRATRGRRAGSADRHRAERREPAAAALAEPRARRPAAVAAARPRCSRPSGCWRSSWARRSAQLPRRPPPRTARRPPRPRHRRDTAAWAARRHPATADRLAGREPRLTIARLADEPVPDLDAAARRASVQVGAEVAAHGARCRGFDPSARQADRPASRSARHWSACWRRPTTSDRRPGGAPATPSCASPSPCAGRSAAGAPCGRCAVALHVVVVRAGA